MTETERLAAIEAIKSLIARRVRALDTRDWETYANCHAIDHVSSGQRISPRNGRDAMMEALRKQVSGIDTMIHCVHNLNIVVTSPTEAKGQSHLENWDWWTQGGEEQWFHGWGLYDETFGIRDGEWVFTSRQLSWLRQEFSEGAKTSDSGDWRPLSDSNS